MKVSDLLKDYLSHNKAFFNQLKIKKSIHDRMDVDFSTLSNRVHSEFEPVFVLSTGRNGTMLLTHIFELSNQCIAVHEPEPELSMASKLAYDNYKTNAELVKGLFEGARYEMLRTSFLMQKKFIETNNRITFFAWQIAELYPKAKFIHLVRNPESFIKSGISRNWYSGKTLYDEARIVHSDKSLWNSMNEYDKIAWLWNETNQFIEDFKNKSGKDCLTIKAEDLFKDIKYGKAILEYVNITDISDSKLKKAISSKVNVGKTKTINSEHLKGAVKNYATLINTYQY